MQSFNTQWTCRPVALKGLELFAKERMGDGAIIDHRIKIAIQDQFILLLLLPFTPSNSNDDFNYVGTAYRQLGRSNSLITTCTFLSMMGQKRNIVPI